VSNPNERPNARFWASVNGGLVKLTLAPGDVLWHKDYRTTDEGWERAIQGWHYSPNGPVVYREGDYASKDCDGRHGHATYDLCHLDHLRALVNIDGLPMPDWKPA
jgi:hypothetical protein